ncbi:MAG: sensor histidine kinase [Anaerolineales bacterium]|nr:sensor histidine kinase [Anaerolineales bacterium]
MTAHFFAINRPLVLFGYGLTFFVMGLAIFLQSRRHSRLRLARDLRWLAGFGVLHGVHEWGGLFIPIQAEYLPRPYIELMLAVQIGLLGASFACLMLFGAAATEGHWGRLHWVGIGAIGVWGSCFWLTFYLFPTADQWLLAADVWARYLLGLPGSLLSAFGLYRLAKETVAPLGANYIFRTLQVAGAALIAYAVLGGLIVPSMTFPPARWVNREGVFQATGVPVEVFRSLAGLVLAVAVIRALEVFEDELDELIEGMEADRIQTAERSRIGQEIHDGALQGVYSAGLILSTLTPQLKDQPVALSRLEQAQQVLHTANNDLRAYMRTLRAEETPTSVVDALRLLIRDPRYRGLVEVNLECRGDCDLAPGQTHHILAIVQECLANVVRHAQAERVWITVSGAAEGLEIRVRDDGRGFAQESITPGWGLRAMQDRARLAGGRLSIESQPGRGTTVTYLALEAPV